ncbi:hypothetical protein [Paenibacillus sp. HW567]|uniref:hypothetical protein n=1 Tax=Paenibacillus sp. HW567 TaxID=1034769 RepID=UPI00035C801A|nr:hypothetical protein [Paenibacillus sp. HW567]
MPRVLTEPVQINQDVEEIVFCDFARLQECSFSYPKNQFYMYITNSGSHLFHIKYNGKSATIEPSDYLEIKENTSEFQIYCTTGSQGFEVRSHAYCAETNFVSQKVLFMDPNPLLSTYNCYASLCSIVPINEENKPWFYSNFTQICYDYNYNWYFFENHNILDTCPWLENYKLRREMISKRFTSIRNFLVDAINDDFYCYLIVNLFHIPSQYYNKSDFPHEILIYGFDLENEEFYIANNFSEGRYVLSKCSFEQMERAFNTVSVDWIEICMYRVKSLDYKVDFNKRYFVNSLRSYLTGQPSILQPAFPSWWTYNCKYGLDVYRHLITIIRNTSADDYLDKRVFCLLQEHKKMMVLRLGFIQEHLKADVALLTYEYEKLAKISAILGNLALKYNSTKNVALLDKIIYYTKDIMEQEDVLIRKLLLNIEENIAVNID